MQKMSTMLGLGFSAIAALHGAPAWSAPSKTLAVLAKPVEPSLAVFAPQYPLPGLVGFTSGATLSWSGAAADATFETLVQKGGLAVRSEGSTPGFPEYGNLQEVVGAQIGCVRFFKAPAAENARAQGSTIESTHCSTHLDPGLPAVYWGIVRVDQFGFFDAGLDAAGSALKQRQNTTVSFQRSAGKVVFQLSGAIVPVMAAANISRQAVACSSGARAICRMSVDAMGRMSSN